MKKLLFLSLWLWVAIITATPLPQTPKNNKPSQKTILCPPITALKKDMVTQTWSAPGGWKNYDTSFVEKITQFLGAQWNGVKIGQITCVYHGAAIHDFPILLIFHMLALEPNGFQWSKNLGGYRNCHATLQTQCPFQVRIQPKKENVYEEAEMLKQKNNVLNNPKNPGF